MAESEPAAGSQAVDMIDGIPDRAAGGRVWKSLLIGGAFAAWVGVLVLLYWWGGS